MLPARRPTPRATVLLMVGRDDWQKDEPLNIQLLERLRRPGLRVVWEDRATAWVHAWLDWTRRYPGLPGRLRHLGLRAAQLAYAVMHPSYLGYLRRRGRRTVEGRCASLTHTVRALARQGEVIVFARSSGGRVASLVADGLALSHIVCLGYPFRHPEAGDEPERYRHLATLRTPMLIVQGRHDVYGGAEVALRYPLSPQVRLRVVEADHDFHLDAAQADQIVALIEAELGW
ncbi:hypothetical protein F7Q92_13700 [Ideonella dechloratans]|uniref:KANL3/Tex30 alpha/beta hydrolase-like domain-containing protein n=1 Tax=Ideonella dechloratans TaxID=36863 RepID=A0A643FDL1_IDEDE|nr:alpha/beta family hydrolase [Ideonella dechloratans]KAB0579987.1 hypothetical protein F7Q92_13700 [Ideonella dechloratans]UFU10956.1 hypothetical protein LRM40_04555 [Ideonella dechloratans]